MKKIEPLTKGLLIDEKEKTLKIVSQKFWWDFKKRVEQLLKEIEREKETYRENLQVISGLCIAEEKIKKAFSEVLEE